MYGHISTIDIRCVRDRRILLDIEVGKTGDRNYWSTSIKKKYIIQLTAFVIAEISDHEYQNDSKDCTSSPIALSWWPSPSAQPPSLSQKQMNVQRRRNQTPCNVTQSPSRAFFSDVSTTQQEPTVGVSIWRPPRPPSVKILNFSVFRRQRKYFKDTLTNRNCY